MPPFAPAKSKAEAAARIYSLAGAPPEPLGPGSKEKKSVLVKLADALHLIVDTAATKPTLGKQIAHQIGAPWDVDCWSAGATITLTGLNRLLEASTDLLARRAGAELRPQLPTLLHGWAEFLPARSKLEAVNRISALTSSGPQPLGPGSKERKSVLAEAAIGLDLPVSLRLSKSRLGAALASALAVPWDSTCHSAGETITLDGLNVILAGMERELGVLGSIRQFTTLELEAEAILGVLRTVIQGRWDGRECVTEMREAEFSQWRQTEWPGFYFEYVAIPALIDAFGGGPRAIGSVRFDYALETVWDLKCHSNDSRSAAPLNDQESTRVALDQGPLGLLMLSGDREIDSTGAFDAWHREVIATTKQRRAANSDRRRARKAAFDSTAISAYAIRSVAEHDSLVAAGALMTMRQGRQEGGATRRPKYALDIRRADVAGMAIAKVDLA